MIRISLYAGIIYNNVNCSIRRGVYDMQRYDTLLSSSTFFTTSIIRYTFFRYFLLLFPPYPISRKNDRPLYEACALHI